jgi:prepilin-type processing-associated H-X9-DG protein
MIGFADSRVYTGPLHYFYEGNVERTYVGCGVDGLECGPGQSILSYARRHGRDYNTLFCDGHAERINPSLLFNPTNMAPRWNRDHQPHPETWVDTPDLQNY